MKKSLIAIIACLLMLFSNHTFAIQVTFHGSGGINLSSGGDIESICPQNSKAVCAEVTCTGLLAWIKCAYLWIRYEGAAPGGKSGLGMPGTITEYKNGVPVNVAQITVYHSDAHRH